MLDKKTKLRNMMFVLRNCIDKQTPDGSKQPIEVEAFFDLDLFASCLRLFNDANDHFLRIFSKHREYSGTECYVWVDTTIELEQRALKLEGGKKGG